MSLCYARLNSFEKVIRPLPTLAVSDPVPLRHRGAPPQTVSVLFCPESEVSPAGAIFPLRLEKSAMSSTGYFLYVQDFEGQGTGPTGFNLYAGALGQWYSHGDSDDNFCSMIDLDLEVLGTGELRYTLQVPIADAYFLITGWEGDVEGVSHRTSDGTPVDETQNTCAP